MKLTLPSAEAVLQAIAISKDEHKDGKCSNDNCFKIRKLVDPGFPGPEDTPLIDEMEKLFELAVVDWAEGECTLMAVLVSLFSAGLRYGIVATLLDKNTKMEMDEGDKVQ